MGVAAAARDIVLPGQNGQEDEAVVPSSPSSASSAPKHKLIREADEATDNEEESEEENGEESSEAEEVAEPHVEINLGLGVMDVAGDAEVLLQKGIHEAAGHLPGEE